MQKYKLSQNEIVIKHESFFVAMGIGFLCMVMIGIRFMLATSPVEDIIGFIFLCVWTLITLSMSVYGFTMGSIRIIINNDGIIRKSWFGTKLIKWEDIKDWGLSYCGRMRDGDNIYFLYFSEHECRTKNDCKKSLKGKMIKTYIIGDNYFGALQDIIPFCQKKAIIEPFIAEDKPHFI